MNIHISKKTAKKKPRGQSACVTGFKEYRYDRLSFSKIKENNYYLKINIAILSEINNAIYNAILSICFIG